MLISLRRFTFCMIFGWVACAVLAGEPPPEASDSAKKSLGVLPLAVRNTDPDLADAFADRLSKALKEIAERDVVSLRQAQGMLAMAGVPWGDRRPTTLEASRQSGKALGVDLVACGGLWGYDDRQVLTLRVVAVETGLIETEITDIARSATDLLETATAMAKALAGPRKQARDRMEADDAGADPAQMLEEAKQLHARKQWRKALGLYKQVRLTSLADDELDKRTNECYRWLSLEMRHRSKEFSASIENMTRATGQYLLRSLLDRIKRHYVSPPTNDALLRSVAEQIQGFVESASAQQRYRPLSQPETRERLAAAAVRLGNAALGQDGLESSEVEAAIESRLLDAHPTDLPAGVLLSEAVYGVMAALDKYSVYMPPDRLRELEIETKGHFCGIGAEVTMRGKLLTIVTPMSAGPAAKAGLVPEDRLILIDGKWGPPTIPRMQAIKRLRGPYRTPVEIHVVTDGEPFPVKHHLLRGVIPVASVKECRILDGSPGIGYVALVAFSQRAPSDLADSLRRLESQGTSALVLDLRGNSGGLLKAAVEIADLFVDEEVIVSTRGRTESSNQTYQASRAGSHTRYPVAVLVNGRSASASEIVASVIRDHRRGPLVGTRTVGKGSVQAMVRFRAPGDKSPLGGANLTVARYFPPCGESFDGVGISPDIAVDTDHKTRRALRGRKTRRWILRNLPGYRSKRASWHRAIEQDAGQTDVDVDIQLAKAVDALKRTLETGTWLANETPAAQQLHP